MEAREKNYMDFSKNDPSKPLRVTDPPLKWQIDDGIVTGVLTKAVWAAGQRPGTWQKMIKAMHHGAEKTEQGTVNAFLFQAMVDRLLEESHALEDK